MERQNDDCGFSTAVGVIGGKWKSDILWQLHVAPRRFGRLRSLIPGISEKMLMQQLREMERDGIIDRKESPERPVKVVYSLTPHGASLNDGVTALSKWGLSHRARTDRRSADIGDAKAAE
jgi:DNA-binding HxlR family transcriptional regulator